MNKFSKKRILATCKKLVARYTFPQRIDLINGDCQDVLQGVLHAVGIFKMKKSLPILSIFDPRVQLLQIVA